MMSHKKVGRFVSGRPGEYRVEPLHIPKPRGRPYMAGELDLVHRIKMFDTQQRRALKAMKDAESHYVQRRPTANRSEMSKLYDRIDSLANTFRVRRHDKDLAIRYLGQMILSNDMELEKMEKKKKIRRK